MKGSEPKYSIRRIVYFLFSLALTVSIFGYLLTEVSFEEVLQAIQNVDRNALLLFVVLSFSMSGFRTWRYALVLAISGYYPRKSALFLVTLVRNFCSDLLPARIGTLVYVYLVTTRLGVPFGAAASSFSLAFLFDLLALAPMIAAAAWLTGSTGELSRTTAIASGAVLLLIASTAVYALPSLARLAGEMVWRLPLIRPHHRAIARDALYQTNTDLRKARKAGVYGRLLALSVLVRICKYGSLYVLLFALLQPMGYELSQLSVPKVFLGLCAAEMAASLPISGIGGFGAYEGAWAWVFGLLGFPQHTANLTAITHHLLTQVYGYLLGAVALLVLLLPNVRQTAADAVQTPSVMGTDHFYGKLILSTLLIVAIALAVLTV